ncbi:MAG: peptidase domain-containing ABC transporter [Magnetococcales bacterium]|nr:peptidase domain-containing ABC transporter [Magnetococcales bacterium]
MSSSLKSLVLVARQHGIELNAERLQHELAIEDKEAGDTLLVQAAQNNGLKARLTGMSWEKLGKLGKAYPAIVRLKNGHCVVLMGFQMAREKEQQPEHVLVLDPTDPNPQVQRMERERFEEHWNGNVILITRAFGLTDPEQPFSWAWLIGAMLQQKSLLAGLFVIAIFLQLFALLPIIYIMIILDKVVNYHATSTLYVFTIGVLIAFVFNGMMGYLREYIILFITSGIDVRLNAKIFTKLLNLPLNFFQKQESATIAKMVQQTNTIRNTLSGKVFAALLDSTALLIFTPILFLYSPLLSAVVILFSVAIAMNVIITSRVQKRYLQKAMVADIQKQNILNSAIIGIETIKSLSIEPVRGKEWENAVYSHSTANFELGRVNAISAQIGATLQNVMTVSLIFVGVNMVLTGDLSPGVLIGVNMLGGRVTSPLVQLVTLQLDLGRLASAIDSLAIIWNTRGETVRQNLPVKITGGLQFSNVCYSYPDGSVALDHLSFTIPPRTGVAIVGTPGAGKSSLALLAQKFLRPDSGTISIDDHDLRLIDPGILRMSVAAVNDATMLFGGTIRDNILEPFPTASPQRMLWASRITGLHDHVEKMPEAYETMLDEGGSNVSTGLRMRICVTRALIRNPNLLILDNIFSHFDVDDVLDFKARMGAIGTGRTLLLISKQLAPVCNINMIFVMDRGRIVEWGNHQSLLAKKGVYASLWFREMAVWGQQYPGSGQSPGSSGTTRPTPTSMAQQQRKVVSAGQPIVDQRQMTSVTPSRTSDGQQVQSSSVNSSVVKGGV